MNYTWALKGVHKIMTYYLAIFYFDKVKNFQTLY